MPMRRRGEGEQKDKVLSTYKHEESYARSTHRNYISSVPFSSLKFDSQLPFHLK
jgi:hypothetical protein